MLGGYIENLYSAKEQCQWLPRPCRAFLPASPSRGPNKTERQRDKEKGPSCDWATARGACEYSTVFSRVLLWKCESLNALNWKNILDYEFPLKLFYSSQVVDNFVFSCNAWRNYEKMSENVFFIILYNNLIREEKCETAFLFEGALALTRYKYQATLRRNYSDGI